MRLSATESLHAALERSESIRIRMSLLPTAEATGAAFPLIPTDDPEFLKNKVLNPVFKI